MEKTKISAHVLPSALSESLGRSRRSPGAGLLTLGVAALFLVGFLLLLIFGARTYQGIAAGQEGNNTLRSQLSYLSAVARSWDADGGLRILEDSTVGPMLTAEDGNGYALRVYQHQGLLLEDYAPADTPPDPDRAQVIGETATFSIREEGGLLSVRTDQGQVLLHARTR